MSTKSPAEPAQTATAAPATKPLTPAQREDNWVRAIVPLAVVLLVIAVVAFPRRSPAPVAGATSAQAQQPVVAAYVAPSAQSIAVPPAPSAAPAATAIVVTPRPVNNTPKKPTTKTPTHRVTPATSLAPADAAAAVGEEPRHEEPAAKPAPEATPTATTTTASALPPPVTVTGCLEVSTDGDTFRLNDVEGVDAPKSRSWRTGFLKKHPAPVMLVEPLDRQALTSNVGRRVAATGQLTNRDLKVATLRVVASSCN